MNQKKAGRSFSFNGNFCLFIFLMIFISLSFSSCSKTGKNSSPSVSYNDFDTYYLTTTHDIALGNVSAGTPVWFYGRANVYNNSYVLQLWDKESEYRLNKDSIVAENFVNAFILQPSNKYSKIFGYVDQKGRFVVLRVEHSGKGWWI